MTITALHRVDDPVDFVCISQPEPPKRSHRAKPKECKCTWCGFTAVVGDPCQWAPGGRHESGAVNGKN